MDSQLKEMRMPYDQATRRELRIQYRLVFAVHKYYELTIYDKTDENLFKQQRDESTVRQQLIT